METYRIVNAYSLLILGNYKADSPEEALDLYAQDQGYANYAIMCETGVADGEIMVRELEPQELFGKNFDTTS